MNVMVDMPFGHDRFKRMRHPDIRARFWSKVIKSDNCWTWVGDQQTAGYGRFKFTEDYQSRTIAAHRYSYMLVHGFIEHGLVIDHLCKNKACVNPSHLESVTHRENMIRGPGFSSVNAAKTHCVHGHEFTPDNTVMRRKSNSRCCRACRKAQYEKRKPTRRVVERKIHPCSAKTHCPLGHPYDGENTVIASNGGRACRACRVIHSAKLVEKRRTARRVAQ